MLNSSQPRSLLLRQRERSVSRALSFASSDEFMIRIGRERDIAQMQRLDGLPGLRAFHREFGHGVRAAREFDDVGIDR